jgi:hypothetical protein
MEWSAKHNFDLQGDRVREHTAPIVNRRIDRATRGAVDACVREGRNAVFQRLGELDREWNVDRALMVNFAIAGGISSVLAYRRVTRRRWLRSGRNAFLYLFGSQLAFLLLHGIVGWCPPASLFRRLGFRTQSEIDGERFALLRFLETEPDATRAGT